MKKILIVEDSTHYQQRFKQDLENTVIVLQAFSVPEARTLYEAHNKELAAIAVDGYVPGEDGTTVQFVKDIRPEFKGVIIAISTTINTELLEAGCDHAVTKEELSATIHSVI